MSSITLILISLFVVVLIILAGTIAQTCRNAGEIFELHIVFPAHIHDTEKFEYVIMRTLHLEDIEIVETILDMGDQYVFNHNQDDYTGAKGVIINYMKRKEADNG
jgi:hypothetical protein